MVLLGGVNEYTGAVVTALARSWEGGFDGSSSEADIVCDEGPFACGLETVLEIWQYWNTLDKLTIIFRCNECGKQTVGNGCYRNCLRCDAGTMSRRRDVAGNKAGVLTARHKSM